MKLDFKNTIKGFCFLFIHVYLVMRPNPMLSAHVQQVFPDRNANLWKHSPTGGFGAAVVSETAPTVTRCGTYASL